MLSSTVFLLVSIGAIPLSNITTTRASLIKDVLSQSSKPTTFYQLKAATQSIDAHYWEHNREKVCSEKDTPKSDKPASSNKFPSAKPSASTSSTTTSSSTSTSSAKLKSSASKSSSKPDLSDKLGKDGKLTAEERKCCFDQNLCMFCGILGHKAAECHKAAAAAASAPKAKAHLAKASDASKDSAEDPKK